MCSGKKIIVSWSAKAAESARVKSWEIIADNLSKAGWSWGCVSAVDRQGRTIWVADAHRGDGKRFVVHADELLTAFLELESAIRFVQNPRGLCSARNKVRQTVAKQVKLPRLRHPTFQLIFGRLNKPQGLDLR
jgi:hypothetical protein